MKVYVYTHDPMLHMLYSKEEAEDLFGEWANEYCIDIPEDIYKKFKRAEKDLYDVSDTIKEIYENKNKHKYRSED